MTLKKSARRGRSCLGPVLTAVLLAASIGPALAVEMPDACDYDPKAGKPFDLNITSEFTSDYLFRGVTLSGHQPSVSYGLEADHGPFYFTFQAYTVDLPTRPSAELDFGVGWCREVLKNVKLNLGLVYYHYANEIPFGPVTSTSYGEAQASIAYEPTEMITLSALYAYSPNYSNTGAWEHYVEGGLEISYG
jgi:uncharacterized protein (TIGR02001 family)